MENLVIDKLKDTGFFSHFPTHLLEQLESKSTVRKYKNHSHVISMGDESHAAYLLLSGEAYAYTDDEDGNEFVVNTFKPGDFFGELGLLDNLPRAAHVITTSEATCLAIPKKEFQRCISEDINAANATIQVLVARIRHMTEDVSSLALMDVYGRVSRALTNAVNETDGDVSITSKLTHQDLANRVGSSREMVGKILKDLINGGYISNDKKRIRILRPLPQRW